MSRVFANGPRARGSILGQVIPKTQKMVLDSTFLTTQHFKVWIKGKVEQSREGGVVAIEKGVVGSSLIKVANFTYILELTISFQTFVSYGHFYW